MSSDVFFSTTYGLTVHDLRTIQYITVCTRYRTAEIQAGVLRYKTPAAHGTWYTYHVIGANPMHAIGFEPRLYASPSNDLSLRIVLQHTVPGTVLYSTVRVSSI
jgi:hypothetical protein